jgi:hypothetical protein
MKVQYLTILLILAAITIQISHSSNGVPPQPGLRILEYLHAHGESTNLTLPQPIKGIYILDRWVGTPGEGVIAAVDQGYNVILLSFLHYSGPISICESWAAMNETAKTSAILYAHARGAVVMVSVGGDTEYPYVHDPLDYGRTVAAWANAQLLDGG